MLARPLLQPPFLKLRFANQSIASWFILLLGVYLTGHTLIRLLLWRNLEYDEAEQLIFVQTLAWGYSSQPPLYTWLLWGWVQLLGPSVAAIALLKASLLAALYGLLFLVSRRVLKDPRLALLTAFSPLLISAFAWEGIRTLTHTMLLCVLFLASWHSLLRIQASGKTRDFLLLGLWLGLGLLAKYNAVLYSAALLGAALSLRAWRQCLCERRLILTLGLALTIAAPHAFWLMDHFHEATHSVLRHSAQPGMPAPPGIPAGLGNLGKNLAVGLVPLVVAAICFAPSCLPGRQSTDPLVRLLDRFCLVTLGLLVGLLILTEVRNFRLHWFGPLLLVLPLAFFAHYGRAHLPAAGIRRYGLVLAVSAVAILGVRLATLCFDYQQGMFQTRDFLYATQTARARQLGFGHGRIIAGDPVTAGYQRLYYPEVPVECLHYPVMHPPVLERNQPTLLVWDATHQPMAPIGAAHAPRTSGPVCQLIEVAPCVFDSSTKRLGFCYFPATHPAALPVATGFPLTPR